MKIKVAHVTTIDLSLRYLLLNQLASIQAVGFEVWGISTPGLHVSVLEAAGIRHIPVTMTRNFTPLADLKSLWQLYRVFRREKFTIVHTHNPKPGLLGQLAARLAGVPIVVNTLHGFYFHEHTPPFWRRFYITTEKIAARCSDVILSQNSEDMQTAVQESILRSPDQMKLLGNGIDIRRFQRSHLDEGRLAEIRRELQLKEGPVIGFVGRLVEEKGILELLAAAQMVRQEIPEVQFLFVGPIDYEKPDALKPDIAAEYGLEGACIFAGTRHDMPEMYALMDVFVLPSHREGFPRSPMEASAMEVPSVVTDIRGCREAVEDGRNGLLVPLKDAGALAQALLRLLCDPALRQQLGQAGRQMAEGKFDEALVFAKVKAQYKRLLADKGFPLP